VQCVHCLAHQVLVAAAIRNALSNAHSVNSAQVRFCVWLPVQLIGNLIAVAALPRMGALYEAAGAAPAASVVAWGAAYHLTLGLLLPGTRLTSLFHRSCIRQFLPWVLEAISAAAADNRRSQGPCRQLHSLH